MCFVKNWGWRSLGLIAWLSCSAILSGATLLVDRTGQFDADYRSLQEAMEAAEDGDTVYVAPSNLSYGDVILGKSVRLVGVGIPSEDLLPWRTGIHSRIGKLTFQPGADAALVMGLDISTVDYMNSEVAEREHPHGVTFYRNLIGAVTVQMPSSTVRPINNLRFINNMMGDLNIGSGNFRQDINNVQILNNVIRSHISFRSQVNAVTGVCRNNFIFESSRSFLELSNPSVSFVDNVVFISGDVRALRSGLHGPVWPPLTAGNVFIGGAPLKSEDEKKNLEIDRDEYRTVLPKWDASIGFRRGKVNAAAGALIADSHPAKTAGVDGGEPGIFGGAHPFDLYQMPPLPFVSRVEAPAIVSEGEGMQVTVEIKSHR